MRKSTKKGFTIVELVIVIAVIAILAAVLIPTFTGIIRKARESTDIQLIRSLNTAVATENALNGGEKNANIQGAVNAALDAGFDLDKIKATAKGNAIVWDSVNDVFCYYDNDEGKVVYIPEQEGQVEVAAKEKFWVISDVVVKNYSTYLNNGFVVPANGEVEAYAGLHVGNVQGIKEIVFNKPASALEVAFYTNGGTLTINDKGSNSKVYHYGTLEAANVNTDMNCFYTNGQIAAMHITAGKVIAQEGSIVALVEAGNEAVVEKTGSGVLYIPDGVSTEKVQLTAANLTALGYETETVDGKTVINANAETQDAISYKIGSVEDLLRFRDNWNRGAIVTPLPIVLTADIDITGLQWAPMGNWANPFHGTINGNGHTIKGLTATKSLGANGVYSVGENIGFGETFGFIGIAGNGDITISDLKLTDVNVDLASGKNVGALIGYIPNNSKFKSDGETYADNKWADDAIVGTNGIITISNVTVSGKVSALQHVGGVIGKAYGSAGLVLTGVKNSAAVTAKADNASGIVGYMSSNTLTAKFDNCQNTGVITAGASAATGLIGLGNKEQVLKVTITTDCSTTATVTIKGGGNTMGAFNADKTAMVYTTKTNKNTMENGAYLIGGPTLQKQPTIIAK